MSFLNFGERERPQQKGQEQWTQQRIPLDDHLDSGHTFARVARADLTVAITINSVSQLENHRQRGGLEWE